MYTPLAHHFSVAASVAQLLDKVTLLRTDQGSQDLVLDLLDTKSLGDLDQLLAKYDWPFSYHIDSNSDDQVIVIGNRFQVPFNNDLGLNWSLAR